MLPHPDDAFDTSAAALRDDGDLRDLSPPRRFRRWRLLAQCAVCAALIASLSLFARERTNRPEPASVWREPPRAEEGARRAIAATEPILTLRAEADAEPARPEPTRWNSSLGQREDSVVQGAFDQIESPYLLITATDSAKRAEAGPSLFVTLARRAADGRSLSVTRTGERGTITTRHGRFETVETTLSGAGKRLCTGFRSIELKAVAIDGWLCGILGQVPEPKAVACALDRIVLAGRIEAIVGADAPTGPSACAADDMAGKGPMDRTGSIALAEAQHQPMPPRHNEAKSRRK